MNTLTLSQGTPEWLQARAGRVTASRVADIMAKGRSGGESAGRRNYRAQLVAEILTGKPQEDGFKNAAMEWGTQNEPFARAAYEVLKGCMVDQVGMVLHPTIERGAASPDGLIGWAGGEAAPEGLIEIKCPNTATHLDYLQAGTVPTDYQPQMLWQMACTGAQWCDFVSFDPRLPEDLQLFVKRFPRDDARIASMEMEVRAFLREVDETITNLRKIRPAA